MDGKFFLIIEDKCTLETHHIIDLYSVYCGVGDNIQNATFLAAHKLIEFCAEETRFRIFEEASPGEIANSHAILKKKDGWFITKEGKKAL